MGHHLYVTEETGKRILVNVPLLWYQLGGSLFPATAGTGKVKAIKITDITQ
jgi:hypothetical protein